METCWWVGRVLGSVRPTWVPGWVRMLSLLRAAVSSLENRAPNTDVSLGRENTCEIVVIGEQKAAWSFTWHSVLLHSLASPCRGPYPPGRRWPHQPDSGAGGPLALFSTLGQVGLGPLLRPAVLAIGPCGPGKCRHCPQEYP